MVRQIESIDDLKRKIKACKELGLNFEIYGTLKEFDYDNIDNSIVGNFKDYPEETEFLRTYAGFDESKIKFKKVHANDDIYLPDETPIDFDCIVFGERFFIINCIDLIIKEGRF